MFNAYFYDIKGESVDLKSLLTYFVVVFFEFII